MISQVKKILKNSPDPLNVRKSTASVFDNLKYINIDFDKINKVATVIKEKIDKGKLLDEEQFGSKNPSPQLIFVLDAINFCFWAKKGQEKWTVEYPKGNYVSNGWYALVASLQRAQKESIPILDAKYLKNLTLSDTKHIFESANEIEIPLLSERVKNLNEAGKVLLEKYDGNIYNLLASSGLDVGKIACDVVKNFPNFADYNTLNGKKIYFYKRAQIFAYDVSLLKPLKVKNLKALTAFADYKIPQILRAYDAIEYKPELARRIDNYEFLNKGSREETEIRAATIWVCELIADAIGVEPVLIDNALWKMSQSLKDVKPYHRVLTSSY